MMEGELFKFHTDPGHGWFEVSLQQLQSLELDTADISGYSYRSLDGNTLYLEEDGDAGVFVGRYHDKYGKYPEYKVWYEEDSFVRNLPNIHH